MFKKKEESFFYVYICLLKNICFLLPKESLKLNFNSKYPINEKCSFTFNKRLVLYTFVGKLWTSSFGSVTRITNLLGKHQDRINIQLSHYNIALLYTRSIWGMVEIWIEQDI